MISVKKYIFYQNSSQFWDFLTTLVYIVCHLIIWSLGSLVSPVKKEAKGCSGEVVLYQMTFDVLAICCGWEISFQVMIYTIGVKISNKCYFPASSSPTANVCVLCSTFVTMWKEKKFSICSCILSLSSSSSANFFPFSTFPSFFSFSRMNRRRDPTVASLWTL